MIHIDIHINSVNNRINNIDNNNNHHHQVWPACGPWSPGCDRPPGLRLPGRRMYIYIYVYVCVYVYTCMCIYIYIERETYR